MSFRNAVQNPTANKLVAHIAAKMAMQVAGNNHRGAHYNLHVTRSAEQDGTPFVNFQLILVEEPDEVPHMTDDEHRAREEAVFVSKRRMAQVMMKACAADEFIIRLAEVIDGEVVLYSERKAILMPNIVSRRYENAAITAVTYLVSGEVVDIMNL